MSDYGKPPLSEPVSERQLLGALMLSPSAVEQVRHRVEPTDVYDPAHGLILSAIYDLFDRGQPTDAASVAVWLADRQYAVTPMKLDRLITNCASTTSALRHAKAITDAASRRSLMAAAEFIPAVARDGSITPGEAVDQSRALLDSVPIASYTAQIGAYTSDELADMDIDTNDPWVIPHVVRRHARVMVVGPEGYGKSMLLGQMACATAAGVHPFTFRPIDPQPVLLIDLENPRQELARRMREFRRCMNGATVAVWSREQGIDLRARDSVDELETRIREVRPALVCIGPVYKMFTRSSKETDEQVAGEIQVVLDRLRIEHDFALVMEHHAPHADGTRRAMRPFGSSLWLRWPDFGIALTPGVKADPPHSLRVSRYRGDRAPAAWPDRFDRASVSWPWSGYWHEGMPIPNEEVLPPPRDDDF